MNKDDRLNKFLESHPEYRITIVKRREGKSFIHDNQEKIRKALEKEEFNRIRVERIINLRNTRHTLDEIGKEFGVSRERIRQIVSKQSPEYIKEFYSISMKKGKALVDKIKFFCKRCGKETNDVPSKKKIFCSQECYIKYPIPEEIKNNFKRPYDKDQYLRKTYPDYSEKRKAHMRKYLLGIYHNPESRKNLFNKQKIYGKRWRDKIGNEGGIRLENLRAKQRAAYRKYYYQHKDQINQRNNERRREKNLLKKSYATRN